MSEFLLSRIEAIQLELEELKNFILMENKKIPKKSNLYGIWKNIDISDADISDAKKSLFKNAYNFESDSN